MSAATLVYTPVEEIPEIHARARETFRSGQTRPTEFRKEQILAVGYMLKDNEQRFKDAMKHDLGRPELETEFIDFATTYMDVRTAYDNVGKWAESRRAEFNLNFAAMGPRVREEPKGVVLIMSPFNGPIFLLLSPLVGALAAGCTVVLKPSEQTPATSTLFAELVPKYLDNDTVQVINGSIPETTKVLELPWDHILYIGGGRVARIVAEAAAKHLTPMTLELGGKNPVVIDPKGDLKLAAKRVLWGRFLNAGQVCLCPEYVLVPESVQDTLIEHMKEVYHSFYPEGPKTSASLSRIISSVHTARIKGLIEGTNGTIVLGGEVDVEKRYVAPTIVKNVRRDDKLMSEEVFGPVLALVPVKDLDEALDFVRSFDHPLVVYVFSQDKRFQEKVYERTYSGGVVYNETMVSCGVPGLPMGGVGASGYGYYTGRDMFEQFTHKRVTIDNPGWTDAVGFGCRYPPYKSLKPMQALLPSLPPRSGSSNWKSWLWPVGFSTFLVGGASVVLIRFWPDGIANLLQQFS